MEGKHTPGPWVSSSHGFQVLTADERQSICRVTLLDGHMFNAPLIAAAPDMLDACQSARAWLGERRTGEWPYDIAVNEVIDKLDAAIAAATGQGGARP